jgi:hypothetical protein
MTEGSESLQRQRVEERDKPSRGMGWVLGNQREDTSDEVRRTR